MKRSPKSLALVIEDEDSVRSYLVNALQLLHYNALEADNEEDAWQLYCDREDEISFIFTDYRLLHGDGIHLYECVRRRNASIKVIIASAFFPQDFSSIYQDRNAFFVKKPILLPDLMELFRLAGASDRQLVG